MLPHSRPWTAHESVANPRKDDSPSEGRSPLARIFTFRPPASPTLQKLTGPDPFVGTSTDRLSVMAHPSTKDSTRGLALVTQSLFAGKGMSQPSSASSRSPRTPLSAPNISKPLPACPQETPVELPGSILMENAGYPGTKEHTNSGRPGKLLSPLSLKPRGMARPKLPPKNEDTHSMSQYSQVSCVVGDTSGELPRSRLSVMKTRKKSTSFGELSTFNVKQDPNEMKREMRRVIQVFKHRIHSLETLIKERDTDIRNCSKELHDVRDSHKRELESLQARHAMEVSSLKSVLTLLENHYLPSGSKRNEDISIGEFQKGKTSHNHAGSLWKLPARPNTPPTCSGDVTPLTASPPSSPEADQKNANAFAELKRKFQNSVFYAHKLRVHVECSKVREDDLARQLRESNQEVLNLTRAGTDLRDQLDNRQEKINTLEEKMMNWKVEVGRLEEAVNKLDARKAKLDEAEKKCLALRQQLSEREHIIQNLLAERARPHRCCEDRAQDQLSPASSKGSLQDLRSPDRAWPLANDIPAEPQKQIQALEEMINAQHEDIRLYKLDVKGYKKDLKLRDGKIRALQQSVLELQQDLGQNGGEVLQVEVPLGIDLGGNALGIVAHEPQSADSRFQNKSYFSTKGSSSSTPMTSPISPSTGPRTPAPGTRARQEKRGVMVTGAGSPISSRDQEKGMTMLMELNPEPLRLRYRGAK